MMTKIFIIFVMVLIIISLVSGLSFLVRDAGSSKRTVKTLTIRIIMSFILFMFLLIAFKFGFIKPHGI